MNIGRGAAGAGNTRPCRCGRAVSPVDGFLIPAGKPKGLPGAGPRPFRLAPPHRKRPAEHEGHTLLSLYIGTVQPVRQAPGIPVVQDLAMEEQASAGHAAGPKSGI